MMKTIDQINEEIRACKQLLDHYKRVNNGIPSILKYCPLCRIIKTDMYKGLCSDCLWLQYESKTCISYATKFLKSYTINPIISSIKDKQWLKHRIDMLHRWISRLNNELEEIS